MNALAPMAESKQPASHLPTWILIGAFLGLLTGITIGERAAFFEPIGLAYAKMLEIAVFPYLICSLFSGLGSLSRDRAPKLLKASWLVYLLLWTTTFVSLFLLALVIPDPRPPSVLLLDAPRSQINILDLLIPANIIEALTRNFIPSIVVFSIIYSIAIQTVPQKAALIETVEVLRKASVTIWMWIVYFAPAGVFALFASTSGTVDMTTAGSLAVYISLFMIGTLALAFIILPLTLGRIIPVRYGAILRDLQGAFTLALVTTLSAAALPYIQRAAEKLVAAENIEGEEANDIIRATLSISYVLSQLGNYFIALFILYLGYLNQVAFSIEEQFLLPLMTLLSGIGSPSASVDAVAFLADWLRLPDNAANLYVETMTITRYGQVAVSVMGLAFVTLSVPLIYFGRAKIKPLRILTPILLGLCAFAAIGIVGRSMNTTLFPLPSDAALLSRTLEPAETQGVDVTVRKERPETLETLSGAGTMTGIRQRNLLRVGYGRDILPFSYFNTKGELVGYDVSAAYRLARDLHVKLEFVPINWASLEKDLQDGRFDIVMAGAYATPERLELLSVSNFYLVSPVALMVKSHLAKDFTTYEAINKRKDLKLAIFHDPLLVTLGRHLFPNAEINQLDSYDQLPNHPDLDGAIWTLNQAGAWASARTGYTALSPKGIGAPLPFAYLLPPGSDDFLRYLNLLLDLEKTSGLRDRQANYWIEGQPRSEPERRWSLMDNVFVW